MIQALLVLLGAQISKAWQKVWKLRGRKMARYTACGVDGCLTLFLQVLYEMNGLEVLNMEKCDYLEVSAWDPFKSLLDLPNIKRIDMRCDHLPLSPNAPLWPFLMGPHLMVRQL